MNQPVIVWAKRTPFGKYGGKLKHLEPETLLMPLFEEMNSIFPKIIPHIDDVVIGNIVGYGGNIARKALLEAGLAESIPGVTMDRQCGSGLESIIYACRMIQAGASAAPSFFMQLFPTVTVPLASIGRNRFNRCSVSVGLILSSLSNK